MGLHIVRSQLLKVSVGVYVVRRQLLKVSVGVTRC